MELEDAEEVDRCVRKLDDRKIDGFRVRVVDVSF